MSRVFSKTIHFPIAFINRLPGCWRYALLVLEFVFLVDADAMFVATQSGPAAAERSGHERLARGIGVALPCPRRDLLTRHGARLADHTPAGAAHQIDVDMIVVIDVRARRQHGSKLLARRGLHVAQKTLLFRQPSPAVLH